MIVCELALESAFIQYVTLKKGNLLWAAIGYQEYP